MTALIDTSALISYLDGNDPAHARCVDAIGAIGLSELIVAHSYLVAESVAVAQRRLGLAAAKSLLRDFFPALELQLVDEALHAEAVAQFLAGDRGRVSFVDQVSFAFMRREGIVRAITLDRDFAREGFEVLPQ